MGGAGGESEIHAAARPGDLCTVESLHNSRDRHSRGLVGSEGLEESLLEKDPLPSQGERIFHLPKGGHLREKGELRWGLGLMQQPGVQKVQLGTTKQHFVKTHTSAFGVSRHSVSQGGTYLEIVQRRLIKNRCKLRGSFIGKMFISIAVIYAVTIVTLFGRLLGTAYSSRLGLGSLLCPTLASFLCGWPRSLRSSSSLLSLPNPPSSTRPLDGGPDPHNPFGRWNGGQSSHGGRGDEEESIFAREGTRASSEIRDKRRSLVPDFARERHDSSSMSQPSGTSISRIPFSLVLLLWNGKGSKVTRESFEKADTGKEIVIFHHRDFVKALPLKEVERDMGLLFGDLSLLHARDVNPGLGIRAFVRIIPHLHPRSPFLFTSCDGSLPLMVSLLSASLLPSTDWSLGDGSSLDSLALDDLQDSSNDCNLGDSIPSLLKPVSCGRSVETPRRFRPHIAKYPLKHFLLKAIARKMLLKDSQARRTLLKQQLASIIMDEEILWKVRAKQTWLKEGDGNTKFFHSVANGRKRLNYIVSIEIEGLTLHKDDQIREYFFNKFWDVFAPDGDSNPIIGDWSCLFHEQTIPFPDQLPFSADEIKLATFQLEGDKALGPYGFHMVFFHIFWETVKEDIFNVFWDLYNGNLCTGPIGYSYICLIFKKEEAKKDPWGNYLEVHFVQQPFLSDRKGSHDPEPILPGIANPKASLISATRSRALEPMVMDPNPLVPGTLGLRADLTRLDDFEHEIVRFENLFSLIAMTIPLPKIRLGHHEDDAAKPVVLHQCLGTCGMITPSPLDGFVEPVTDDREVFNEELRESTAEAD
ncbi:hypothetical protein ACMD2_21565 [Ananas comosus]|uniref:Uncharacterized protein n=1 Tax=Ananas comosus TaxID=4615 RepID=A0A199V9E8_ANACO|nr:hypothetical protein ACMD2_21565 [Ananas comosus]